MVLATSSSVQMYATSFDSSSTALTLFHLVQRVACQDATAQVSFYRHLISLADVNLI